MKTAEEATQDITEVTWQQYEDRQDAIQAFDPTSPLTLFWRGPCILVVATHPAILISAKTTDEGNNSFRSCSKNTNPDHSARVLPIDSQSRHSPSKVIADIQQWQINGLTVSSLTGGSWARQWGKKGVAQTLLAQSGRTAIFFIQTGESKSLDA
jgi:hypothetical protein